MHTSWVPCEDWNQKNWSNSKTTNKTLCWCWILLMVDRLMSQHCQVRSDEFATFALQNFSSEPIGRRRIAVESECFERRPMQQMFTQLWHSINFFVQFMLCDEIINDTHNLQCHFILLFLWGLDNRCKWTGQQMFVYFLHFWMEHRFRFRVIRFCLCFAAIPLTYWQHANLYSERHLYEMATVWVPHRQFHVKHWFYGNARTNGFQYWTEIGKICKLKIKWVSFSKINLKKIIDMNYPQVECIWNTIVYEWTYKF